MPPTPSINMIGVPRHGVAVGGGVAPAETSLQSLQSSSVPRAQYKGWCDILRRWYLRGFRDDRRPVVQETVSGFFGTLEELGLSMGRSLQRDDLYAGAGALAG